MTTEKIKELKKIAARIRVDIIEMLGRSGSGHPGGSLSIADIMAVLYFYKMKVDPKDPDNGDRDRFVLSKGHGAPALYSCLANAGFFSKEYLKTLRQVGSSLQGHPCISLPGIDMTTGSLGQGLSAAHGMAIAAKMDGKSYKVYCIIGDGESQEGQIWEAAMSAGQRKTDNLIVFLDHNKLQIDGRVEDIKGITPIADKWRAFRWNVIDNVGGHDIPALMKAVDDAEKVKGKPTIIICDTVKGKGVSFMEDNVDFHGKAPNKGECDTALDELKCHL
jgi:transketolase